MAINNKEMEEMKMSECKQNHRIPDKDSEALRILRLVAEKINDIEDTKEMDAMNQELYELAVKQLNALDVKKLTVVEVRHVEDPADEYGVKENRIQIDIYYNEVDTKAWTDGPTITHTSD